MDSKWLRDLIALHAAKSFSRASERRNITQSAFSRRIRALEDWVGTPLVQRDSVPLELTEAGHRLLSVGASIVAQIDEIEEEFAVRRGTQNQLVRIGAQHSPAITILPQLLQKLHDHIPHLHTHVISGNLNDCIDRLNSGVFDIVICHTHPSIDLQIDREKFELFNIGDDSLVPVAASATIANACWSLPGNPANPTPLLTYEKESFLGLALQPVLGRSDMNVKIRHIDSYSEALKKCVVAGLGIAWLPRALIEQEITSGELVPMGDQDLVIKLEISVIVSNEAFGAMPRAVCAYFRDHATVT